MSGGRCIHTACQASATRPPVTAQSFHYPPNTAATIILTRALTCPHPRFTCMHDGARRTQFQGAAPPSLSQPAQV